MPNIIGHQTIIQFFDKAIKSDKLAHAYMFVGAEHVGKTTVAMWLVEKALNNERMSKEADRALFWSRPHPDMVWIKKAEDKKEISLEQIKSFRKFMQQKSFVAKHKAVIIENVELLSTPALNSLLKTLEEPPGESLIILTTSNTSLLPATLVSRCQLIKFKRVSIKDIAASLPHLAAESSSVSGAGVKNNRLKKAKKTDIGLTTNFVKLTGGLPGLAVAWLEKPEEYATTAAAAAAFLDLVEGGISQRLAWTELFLACAVTLRQQADLITGIMQNWQAVIRDIILLKAGLSDNIINVPLADKLGKIASSKDTQKPVAWLKLLDKTRSLLDVNVNPRLALENFLINL